MVPSYSESFYDTVSLFRNISHVGFGFSANATSLKRPAAVFSPANHLATRSISPQSSTALPTALPSCYRCHRICNPGATPPVGITLHNGNGSEDIREALLIQDLGDEDADE
ncbi:hypothetical protein J3458_021473 [Metarhizium acridum]|uniref:uncharacterized protein n=1 Tax=Metarhizium acridum TaxID=92637 RepID=UPI001C6C7B2E|nr:hypothetical protein J3458_021473 [Metarhizium acridum]